MRFVAVKTVERHDVQAAQGKRQSSPRLDLGIWSRGPKRIAVLEGYNSKPAGEPR